MPHVIVKMFAGRNEADKKRLADAVANAVMNSLGTSESSISVAIEDVSPDEWMSKVYEPDILGEPVRIFKKPGYKPF